MPICLSGRLQWIQPKIYGCRVPELPPTPTSAVSNGQCADIYNKFWHAEKLFWRLNNGKILTMYLGYVTPLKPMAAILKKNCSLLSTARFFMGAGSNTCTWMCFSTKKSGEGKAVEHNFEFWDRQCFPQPLTAGYLRPPLISSVRLGLHNP